MNIEYIILQFNGTLRGWFDLIRLKIIIESMSPMYVRLRGFTHLRQFELDIREKEILNKLASKALDRSE